MRTYLRWAALSLAISLPVAVKAQTPDALLSEIWADFSRSCVPFLTNPQAAKSALPRNVPQLTYSESLDGSIFHRHEGDWHSGGYRLHKVFYGARHADVFCEITRTKNRQPFTSDVLEAALRRLVPQTGPMRLAGGAMQDVVTMREFGDVDNSAGVLRVFSLEGALGARSDLIKIHLMDNQVRFIIDASVALKGES